MLKGVWQEVNRLQSLFLEIIEDPTKKEVLLYPICYCQLVRKENSFEIELERLIACASKTFNTFRGRWQDVLLELDLFQFMTPTNEVLYGKDILSVSSPENLTVSFLPEYREIFYEVYSKLLKYWTVLSKISSYSKSNTPVEAVHMSVLIFNEELFEEVLLYTGNQELRFKEESPFFSAVGNLAQFYIRSSTGRELPHQLLETALEDLNGLDSIFYGVNIAKLRADVSSLLKDIRKGKKPGVIKICFIVGAGHGKGVLRRVLSKLVNKLREFGGRKWTLMSSGTVCSSFTEIYLKRQRGLQILA